jgi:acid stress-induced BolA-like protein IbaG/YrbA
MIENAEIEKRLLATNEVSLVKVDGDGYHYQLTVVADVFLNRTTVARQQWIYAQLKDLITAGSLHAITMKTFTTEEWEKKHG